MRTTHTVRVAYWIVALGMLASLAYYVILYHVMGTHEYGTHRTELSSFINKVQLTEDMSRPVNCPKTRTKPIVTLCLHEPLDEWSAVLLKQRVWEIDTTVSLYKMLSTYPNASFIDLGSNLGYFSHLAAARGRKVVAVDALEKNIRPLLWSAKIDGRGEQITMLLNAVSNNNREMALSTPVEGQHGSKWALTFVGEVGNAGEAWTRDRKGTLFKKTLTTKVVKTITVNDLVGALTTSVAILKIDVEGHECNAMNETSSSHLFAQVFVPYVIMEWSFVRHASRIPTACTAGGVVTLVRYLTSLGYRPYLYSASKNQLQPLANTSKDTGSNIIWVHSQAKDFLSAKY